MYSVAERAARFSVEYMRIFPSYATEQADFSFASSRKGNHQGVVSLTVL